MRLATSGGRRPISAWQLSQDDVKRIKTTMQKFKAQQDSILYTGREQAALALASLKNVGVNTKTVGEKISAKSQSSIPSHYLNDPTGTSFLFDLQPIQSDSSAFKMNLRIKEKMKGERDGFLVARMISTRQAAAAKGQLAADPGNSPSWEVDAGDDAAFLVQKAVHISNKVTPDPSVFVRTGTKN